MRRLRSGVRFALLAAAVVVVVLLLHDQGAGFGAALRRTGAATVAAAGVAVLAGLLCSAMVWRALLADLGSRIAVRPALYVFFVGQLGKYLPGSVFAVAAQMSLGRDQGVPRSRVGTASLLFMGVLVATGLLVAVLALPLSSPGALHDHGWVLLALPVGLACLLPPVLTRLVAVGLRLLKRDPLERALTARRLAGAVGWSLAMWACYGLHVWLLARPLAAAPGGVNPGLAVGGYALAWTAGFLFVLAPAGGLVREVTLVALLAAGLAHPQAAAVAVVSRVLMTGGDVVWAAVGALLRPRVVYSPQPVQQLGKAADV